MTGPDKKFAPVSARYRSCSPALLRRSCQILLAAPLLPPLLLLLGSPLHNDGNLFSTFPDSIRPFHLRPFHLILPPPPATTPTSTPSAIPLTHPFPLLSSRVVVAAAAVTAPSLEEYPWTRIDDTSLVLAHDAPKPWQLFGGPARVTGVSQGFSARPHEGSELPRDAVAFLWAASRTLDTCPARFCDPTHDLVLPPVFCTSHAIALDSDRRSTTVHQFTGRSLLGWQGRRITLYAVEHIYAAEWASIDLRLLI
ncbi:hypothetical protein FJTKL_12465 [Diaporthe vaccinii]|uniref:Uncharacterized protein n=1 Tax=Diaporthe vaccinii TaxID=105482 RepID=A0ABR4EDH6_9PEZI